MLFSSITFLFAFLPVVLLVYYISPRMLRNAVLLLFSLLFYAWGEPRYVFVMMASVLIGYAMGLLTDYFMRKEQIKRAKCAVFVSVALNLGLLVFFKYTGFFAENINRIAGLNIAVPEFALPLGISFYTFQILSYSVDVYRGTVKPQKNIINLGMYITLFPQLIAGPIVRYDRIARELTDRRETTDDFGEGVRRFITGLGKKVLIANTAGEIYDTLSVLSADENTVLLSWICSAAFSLQIYFDFSGYSDMALGLGRMFGFHFPENFDYPYISKSVTEFWRRWHISLSSWFRDYVYIPLGGNRKGKAKTLRNIFIVWILTGFWHGAEWNFVIWGLYYFILLMVEKIGLLARLKKLPAVLQHMYALFFINLGWVIFSYDDIPALGTALGNMFGLNGLPFVNDRTIFYLLSYGLSVVIACLGATPFPKKIGRLLTERKNGAGGIAGGVLEIVFLFAVLIFATAFLASDAFNPFLYFRF